MRPTRLGRDGVPIKYFSSVHVLKTRPSLNKKIQTEIFEINLIMIIPHFNMFKCFQLHFLKMFIIIIIIIFFFFKSAIGTVKFNVSCLDGSKLDFTALNFHHNFAHLN